MDLKKGKGGGEQNTEYIKKNLLVSKTYGKLRSCLWSGQSIYFNLYSTLELKLKVRQMYFVSHHPDKIQKEKKKDLFSFPILQPLSLHHTHSPNMKQ